MLLTYLLTILRGCGSVTPIICQMLNIILTRDHQSAVVVFTDNLNSSVHKQRWYTADLREFYFRIRVGRWGKRKKSSENYQLTGHSQSFFFTFSELFF